MSNERFARQYRFEPPSGFLLTSPCTSIVHHLSGPSMHALARHWPRGLARCLPCAVLQARAISISLCVWVCRPNTRTHVRLLGPCFKTGRASPVARHDPGHAASGDAGRGEKVNLGPGATWNLPRPKPVAVRMVGPETIVPPSGGARPPTGRKTGSLASNDFTYYFTFFSKFFSSFPHGTCSLSVSRKYLALEGHYLPISAAVPSNTTHG